MEFLRNVLDKRVFDFAKATNAKIISGEEARELGYTITEPHLLSKAGSCHFRYDLIVINPNQCLARGFDVNRVVLHELTHWTGRVNRLARALPLMSHDFINQGHVIYVPRDKIQEWNKELPTEEWIAETGMFLLSCQLGLDETEAWKALEHYKYFWPGGNADIALVEAWKAMDYLNQLVNQEVKKVA